MNRNFILTSNVCVDNGGRQRSASSASPCCQQIGLKIHQFMASKAPNQNKRRKIVNFLAVQTTKLSLEGQMMCPRCFHLVSIFMQSSKQESLFASISTRGKLLGLIADRDARQSHQSNDPANQQSEDDDDLSDDEDYAVIVTPVPDDEDDAFVMGTDIDHFVTGAMYADEVFADSDEMCALRNTTYNPSADLLLCGRVDY